MILTNAQIIMATAQAFHESGIELHEVWCSTGLKVVYTWIDKGADKTGWFFFNRGIGYQELVEAIKENVTDSLLDTIPKAR